MDGITDSWGNFASKVLSDSHQPLPTGLSKTLRLIGRDENVYKTTELLAWLTRCARLEFAFTLFTLLPGVDGSNEKNVNSCPLKFRRLVPTWIDLERRVDVLFLLGFITSAYRSHPNDCSTKKTADGLIRSNEHQHHAGLPWPLTVAEIDKH